MQQLPVARPIGWQAPDIPTKKLNDTSIPRVATNQTHPSHSLIGILQEAITKRILPWEKKESKYINNFEYLQEPSWCSSNRWPGRECRQQGRCSSRISSSGSSIRTVWCLESANYFNYHSTKYNLRIFFFIPQHYPAWQKFSCSFQWSKLAAPMI